MMLFKRSTSLLMVLAGTAALAACSANPDMKAAPPRSTGATDTATGEVAKSVDTNAASETAAAARWAGPRAPIAAADTAHLHLDGDRSSHDNTSYASAIRAGARALPKWPAPPSLLSGSLLPAHRIVAFYGNPHSKKMGVLGEYPEQQMLGMLDKTVAEWRKADPATPVIPAIHLVTVVAQGDAGADGGWRRRENSQTIEQAYTWAKRRNGLLFLDIQAGHSTLQQELPLLLKYLERPDVHLGIDPEFYMHHNREGRTPGSRIG
ncbi:MAG: hypothetical protein ACREMU_07530, partial [Gemmatimonadaceae bacterium]